MGASQSMTETDGKVFQNTTPIHFSQDVVNQLSDGLTSPETTPERQSMLDAHIRSRIQSELEHLRKEEDNVRQEVEQALERENLDRERNMAGDALEADGSSIGGVKSGAVLMGDLEEIRKRVDRFQSRRDISGFPAVKASGEEVTLCYKTHPTTPLECWREVNKFKVAVAQVEQQHFKSLTYM